SAPFDAGTRDSLTRNAGRAARERRTAHAPALHAHSTVGQAGGPCFQRRGSLMPIDERWNQLDASDWDAFAQSWIDELRGTPSDSEANVGQSVVMMNFTARPEHHGSSSSQQSPMLG